MPNFWKMVNNVIESSDIVLEVLDARLVDETRNTELEHKIIKKGIGLIYVINKCDLADKKALDRKKKDLRPSVFVSAHMHLGTTLLRNKILETAKKKQVIVGVVGYPNTGKSSIINALAGRGKAKTSSMSGYTRAIQLIKADSRIKLIDTPGVIPFMEEDEFKHAVIGAKDPSRIKEPDIIAARLIKELEGKVERYYSVKIKDDPEEVLEDISLKLGKLKKGGLADVNAAARIIIKDWQKGLI